MTHAQDESSVPRESLCFPCLIHQVHVFMKTTGYTNKQSNRFAVTSFLKWASAAERNLLPRSFNSWRKGAACSRSLGKKPAPPPPTHTHTRVSEISPKIKLVLEHYHRPVWWVFVFLQCVIDCLYEALTLSVFHRENTHTHSSVRTSTPPPHPQLSQVFGLSGIITADTVSRSVFGLTWSQVWAVVWCPGDGWKDSTGSQG